MITKGGKSAGRGDRNTYSLSIHSTVAHTKPPTIATEMATLTLFPTSSHACAPTALPTCEWVNGVSLGGWEGVSVSVTCKFLGVCACECG